MKTEIKIKSKFLVLPMSDRVQQKRITLRVDGRVVDRVPVRLDYQNPQYNAYYPLERCQSDHVEVEIEPEALFCDLQSDTQDYTAADAYPFRPKLHFTPRFGWINDPNGLVEYTSHVTGKKVYHLFYQYNPYDTLWANMHWGHAVSSDLLHWEHLPVTLYPHDNGLIFSGCAIVDKRNLSGLKQGDEDVILLYYTLTGDSFCQCLAYSTDGGYTFKKYDKNPVLPSVSKENRDPKVIWCEELGCYIMALFLAHMELDYGLFASKDLLHWDKLQEIRLISDGEFPDFYPLCADDNPNDRLWVLTGSQHTYGVFRVQNGKFVQVQPQSKLAYGKTGYSPQSFSDISDGRRISISWHRGVTPPAPAPFSAQLSLPYEMTLKKRRGQYFLCAWPIAELEALRHDGRIYHNLALADKQTIALQPEPCDITITLDDNAKRAIKLRIFGCPVEIDPRNNKVTFPRSSESFPLSVAEDHYTLRIVSDNCGFEMFSDNGAAVFAAAYNCDYNMPFLELSGEPGAEIQTLEIYGL